MKTLISLFLLLALLTCCTDSDEELYTRPYPIVKTNPITHSSVHGEFNAEIIAMNENQIVDHGFEFGMISGYDPWYYAIKSKISLGEGELKEGSKFSAIIPGIYNPKGNTYTVRSYVIAKDTVFGNAAYFVP